MALELDGAPPASKEPIRECRVSRSEALTVHIALASRTKKGTKVDDSKVLCAILVSLERIQVDTKEHTNL